MRPEEAEKKYILLLRSMGGNRRVKVGAELYETGRHIVEASIKNEDPDISEDELRERLRQRMNPSTEFTVSKAELLRMDE